MMIKIKILHITDIEGFIPIIPEELKNEIDFVLISGDISIGAKSIKKVIKSFEKIASVLPDDMKVYYIPGNREYPEVADEFEGMPNNYVPLHNKIKIEKADNGNKIFLIGFGGAIPGILNHFAKTESEIKESLDKLFKRVQKDKKKGDIQILVVHNPPYGGVLDFAKTTNKHIGSKSISEMIEKYQPNVCVCGHVHESQGIEHINKTICVNPGASKHGNASLIEFNGDVKVDIIQIDAKRKL